MTVKESKNKLKESIHKNLHSISIHGIVNIIRSQFLVSTMLWFILTIISICLGSYYALLSVLEYYQYDVTTYVRLITVEELEFPTITICNRNQFSTIESLNYIEQKIENRKEIESISDYDAAEDLFLNISMNESKNLTLSIDKMLISCTFNEKKCGKNDFVWVFNRKYGNCYRFNSKINESKIVNRLISRYGLILDLYLGLPDELKNKSSILNQRSVSVSLTDKKTNPYRFYGSLIELPAGTETIILVEKMMFEQVPKPYSNCSEPNNDMIYYQQITNAGYLYSRTICFDFCLANLTQIQCGCIILNTSLIVNPDFPYKINCKPNTFEYDCANKIYDRKSKFYTNCREICLNECRKEKFSYSKTNSKLNAKNLDDLKQKNMDYDEDDILRLKINYASLEYVIYKERPAMTFFDLISNFGGTLSLFLGKIIIFS
jgi:hypothetical protein